MYAVDHTDVEKLLVVTWILLSLILMDKGNTKKHVQNLLAFNSISLEMEHAV